MGNEGAARVQVQGWRRNGFQRAIAEAAKWKTDLLIYL
jgi:hypothetical protein